MLRLIRSIRKFHGNVIILVVDDGTEAQYEEYSSRIQRFSNVDFRLVKSDSGLAYGRNTLVKLCQTKYMIYFDDDYQITQKTSATKLVAILRQNPGVDIVGGLVSDRLNYRG